MPDIKKTAHEVCEFLKTLPGVTGCQLYGSLSNGTFDEYSDIDVRVDVSGMDNGQFLLELPELFAAKFQVYFYDFAPSLAPEKYVVSLALDEERPYRLVDIHCVAEPHCASVTPEVLKKKNNPYDHLLKLFSVNLRHYLRGSECYDDIRKLYDRVFGEKEGEHSERQMLRAVFAWLQVRAREDIGDYVEGYEQYL